MGRAKTIARRTFLLGSAAVAGGLVVGWVAVKWPLKNPLLGLLDDDDATLNPYVRIDPNGITIITPRTEVGQGSQSVLAALVAEELELDWGSFAIDHGPPSPAYFNSIVLSELLPFTATDDGMLARQGRALLGAYSKVTGVQGTGGSTTVPDGYGKMRMAGAAAREMLLEAAARQRGIPRAELRAESGAVVTPQGERIPYTALAGAAAELRPPRDVALKDPSAWRLLGKPMRRADVVAKSTGTATYGIDLRMPGMVYATVRSNPRIGGGVTSVDDAEAKAARGVLKVVPIDGGVGVIADNTWRAFRAAALLNIQWGAAPYPATTEALATAVARALEGRRDSRLADTGNVDAALAAGATVEAEYRVAYLAHAPLEPMSAVARFADGKLELWAATQTPRHTQRLVGKAIGISRDDVTLHVPLAGGSFGRRLEDDYARQAAQVAAAHPGVPVKMTWTREEDFTHDFPRPLAVARGRGLARDGRVEALDLSVASSSVAASQAARIEFPFAGPDVTLVAGAWDQPYALPHRRITGYRAAEMVPVSSWRSVGAGINAFFHESLLDELIHAAGADPLAERIRLCSDEASRRVLETAGEMSGWGTPLGEGRGRGVAFTLSFGVPVAEVVEVSQTSAGICVDRVFVVVEVGKVLDPVNFENQVQGGVLWGLGHAMFSELTYVDGVPEQTNFHLYQSMRFTQAPQIVVQALETGAVRGIGEPPVPPAAPALANAIFAATGQRIRELPMRRHVRFA